jgi:hypothetical protein
MTSPSLGPSLTDYYLRIQSLTPVDTTQAAPVSPPPDNLLPFQIPVLSVVIFLTVLVLGSFGLLLTKSREINKMFLLLAFAFITSMVPLGLNSLNQQTQLQSQASPVHTPKNVTVTAVTRSSFIISWETDSAQPTILRYHTKPDFDALTQVIQQDQQTPTTSHTVILNRLQARTNYYLQILSGSDWYQDRSGPIQVKTQ